MVPPRPPPPSLAPLLLLAFLVGGARGYGGAGGGQRRPRTAAATAAASVSSGHRARAAAGAGAAATTTTVLRAGLRDLVGPYDDDDYADGGAVLGGGVGGGPDGRRSPGFVGFDPDRSYRNRNRDRNYPDYDVAIDAGPSFGNRRGGRIFDNVPYDDLPGSATRRIGRGDPYDRGLDSSFVETNGARTSRGGPRGTLDVRPRGTLDVRSRPVNDFDDVPRGGRPPLPGGGGGLVPYRRDYYDGGAPPRSLAGLNSVERYFEAWNRRDVPLALSCFADDVYYDDTQFNEPFEGKDKLADHLLYVSDSLPDTFYFVVDELSVGSAVAANRRMNRASSPTFQMGRSRVARVAGRGPPTVSVGALWHVENEFGPLPFARGCSFFKVDPASDLIVEAYDFPEPAVLKTGSTGLRFLSVASKLVREPGRWFPFFTWVAYVYIVFFSNGILPGKDIFHATPKTWEEVQGLSSNFMLLAPATSMPTAAKLNPVLEGIFNGMLAWAFLFTGFLSDERSGMGPYEQDERYYERLIENRDRVLPSGVVVVPPVSTTKKNLIGMVPTIVGMQFLTSAFLLPYLFSRTSERYASDARGPPGGPPRRIRPLYREELDRPALVLGENRALFVFLGFFGLYALWWGLAGKPEFGPPAWVSDKRAVEFMKLLDKDRVSASLVVDLWIFGIFQGWLVDDDWKRRGRSLQEEKFLRNAAKFFPFFGLVGYLVFRPQYPSSKDGFYDDDSFFSSRDSRDRRGFGGFFRGRD